MASIFSKIVKGDIPCYKVAESEDFLAFLDINPLVKGHTLVIPKKEVDYYFDLDDETMTGLNLFAKKVAIAIKAAIPCNRVGTMVIGDEVPHAHLHLVPFHHAREMILSRPKLKLSKEEFAEIAAAIAAHL